MGKNAIWIVLLGVAWSIVQSIMQKRAAAAKKLQMQQGGSSLKVVEAAPQVFSVSPSEVKIEALRRRQSKQRKQTSSLKSSSQPMPTPTRRQALNKPTASKIAPMIGLHDLDCPVPATRFQQTGSLAPSIQLAVMLRSNRNIRTAIVLSEILRKPIALRS